MSAWYNKTGGIMAFPATYDINYYRGDTLEFNIYPKLNDNSAFDLDGYEVKFTIDTARGQSANAKIATASISDNNSFVACSILPATGRQLIAGTTYYYDVEVKKGATKIYTLLTGVINVTEDITVA
jgi:hypothetical protein